MRYRPASSARATGRLAVRTGRTGAAAKAGHNLLIHVMSGAATLARRRRAAPSS